MGEEWKLLGYDTFSEEFYPLEGSYPTEEDVKQAARVRLTELEKTQPTEDSGGQDDLGIQDRVFIIRPNGSKYRYLPADLV